MCYIGFGKKGVTKEIQNTNIIKNIYSLLFKIIHNYIILLLLL